MDDHEVFDPELWIVCSPKTRKVHPDAERMVDFWKYVIEAQHVDEDGFPTRVLGADMKVARPTNPNPIYVQPMDHQNESKNKSNLYAAMKVSRDHGFFLSIQTHKIIGIE